MSTSTELVLKLTSIGLQCHTALFTWKLSFVADGQLYELILSACSAIEENQWKFAFQSNVTVGGATVNHSVLSAVSPVLNLRPCCSVVTEAVWLCRRLSIQRADTVGGRSNTCQVIIRNTHNPQDLQDFRAPSDTVNRSQSHLTTHRIVVLAPKRIERSRLESCLAGVWTKYKLPYPGMIASRGGQIIRASAGSLVRKLSLASMHGSFGRRSSSFTTASQKSFEAHGDKLKCQAEITDHRPCFGIQKETHSRSVTNPVDAKGAATTVSAQTTASSGQPIQTFKYIPCGGDGSVWRTAEKGPQLASSNDAGPQPNDPVTSSYPSIVQSESVEVKPNGKKRGGNPMSSLRRWTVDALAAWMYSSK